MDLMLSSQVGTMDSAASESSHLHPKQISPVSAYPWGQQEGNVGYYACILLHF